MSNQSILIGWATTSITPERPVQLAGQFHERISQGVHDPLTATALALDQGGEQAVIVSCDLLYTSREVHEKVRARLASGPAGLDPQKLFLAATHTHTAPVALDEQWYPAPPPGVMAPAEYIEFLAARLAALVQQAWQARRPGGVSWALGHAVIGHNRRVVYDDGTAVMYGSTDTPHFRHLEGGNDHGVEMLFTWDEAGALSGVVINPACPSQIVEGKSYISADYWSEVRRELRARHGADLFVLPLTSAAGDQSPRDLVRRKRGEPDMHDEPGLREIGLRLAEAVDRVLPAARAEVQREPVLKHIVTPVPLPARRVTAQEAAEAQARLEQLIAAQPAPRSGEGSMLRQMHKLLRRYADQGENLTYDMELHVLRLGDVALATNPCELFLDYGLRIKARSRALQTFIVQLATDQIGYLPTAKAVAGGGYGALVTNGLVGPEGGEVLVERTVELINSLWPA